MSIIDTQTYQEIYRRAHDQLEEQGHGFSCHAVREVAYDVFIEQGATDALAHARSHDVSDTWCRILTNLLPFEAREQLINRKAGSIPLFVLNLDQLAEHLLRLQLLKLAADGDMYGARILLTQTYEENS